jgi:hypothetical protein
VLQDMGIFLQDKEYFERDPQKHRKQKQKQIDELT